MTNMKLPNVLRLFRSLSTLSLYALLAPQLYAQGTAFTYQGRLNSSGGPATGLYDFRFRLATDSLGSNYVGSSILTNGIPVTNGLFTVTLNFGAGIFTGPALWLEADVRTNGGSSYAVLTPLQPVTPSPYAMYAPNAGTANTAASVAAGSVTGAGIASSTITAGNIATGQVVKRINGLADAVTLAPGANISITPSGNTLTIASAGGSSSAWSLTGNAGTTPGVNFLGTTDNEPLELHVDGLRAFRVEPTPNDANHSNIVNIIAGSAFNYVAPGVYGATVSGGGASIYYDPPPILFGPAPLNTNSVAADFGTIGGGWGNTIQANAGLATIAGGGNNLIEPYAGDGVIAGGANNLIQQYANDSFIGGGQANTIQTNSPYATISGGENNTIQTNAGCSFIAGGNGNAIQSFDIMHNLAYLPPSFSSELYSELYDLVGSTIGGGFQNVLGSYAPSSIIGGGIQNLIQGEYYPIQSFAYLGMCVVGGGYQNTNNGNVSTIGGGEWNSILRGDFSTIGGGQKNVLRGYSGGSVVSGGVNNQI
jgi:hypothetical protein